jgi:hypothetical protein
MPVEFEIGFALGLEKLDFFQQRVILFIGLGKFLGEFLFNVGLEVCESLLKVLDLLSVVYPVLLDNVIEGLHFFFQVEYF